MTRCLSVALVFALLPAPLLAQSPSILDVIPEHASAALVLRSIHDFKMKGKKLLADLEVEVEGTPDTVVNMALDLLRIRGGVDEKAPVAIAILKSDRNDELENLVLKIPIADRDKILAGYKLDRKPKDNEIIPIKEGGFIAPRAFVVRGKYLHIGFNEETLKRLTDKSLAISDTEKKQFGDADILLYLGKRAWPLLWGDYLGKLDYYFGRRKDEDERKVGKQFIKGLHATEHSFVSFRLQDGVHLRSNMVFDVKNEKAAREMIEMLKAGTSRSNVKSLSDGRALAALGWAGDGSKNGILVKLFFDVFLEGPLPGKLNDLPIFARTDYPSVVAVSQEIAQRLKGAQVGLYHNVNEKELGLFSALAVIDTDDGAAFLKEIRTLAQIADLKEEDLKLPGTKKLIDVEQLVRDLNSGVFKVRQSATTRLLLLGEPAVPHLQKAMQKPMSLEQGRRAEEIKGEIEKAAAQRRKDPLLANDLPRSIRPTFTIAPKAEMRAGVNVDVLKMTFNTKQAGFLTKVEAMLGPAWDKLRIAVVGNQVVVMLGSDVALLEQTITNLKAGKGGLADGKAFAGFEKHADKNRTAEMHGSAQAFLGLLATEWKLPAKLFRGEPEMTSLSISFETDRMLMEVFVPMRELKTMVHAAKLIP